MIKSNVLLLLLGLGCFDLLAIPNGDVKDAGGVGVLGDVDDVLRFDVIIDIICDFLTELIAILIRVLGCEACDLLTE
jgi:hypothetical protein